MWFSIAQERKLRGAGYFVGSEQHTSVSEIVMQFFFPDLLDHEDVLKSEL